MFATVVDAPVVYGTQLTVSEQFSTFKQPNMLCTVDCTWMHPELVFMLTVAVEMVCVGLQGGPASEAGM
jgi:hypothetical protein